MLAEEQTHISLLNKSLINKTKYLTSLVIGIILLAISNFSNAASKKSNSSNKSKKVAVCSQHVTLRVTCCDGTQWIAGYADFAYWCESGQPYQLSYINDDPYYYSCI